MIILDPCESISKNNLTALIMIDFDKKTICTQDIRIFLIKNLDTSCPIICYTSKDINIIDFLGITIDIY
ncbi:hypothetical protein pb186bvf_015922 [Paramecium bursaria]